MSGRAVFRRPELETACLMLGPTAVDLHDYATTGLRIVVIAPSGSGKTNLGLLCAEQLTAQGWLAVLVDPEGELAELYDGVLRTPDALTRHLEQRDGPAIVTLPARDAEAFVPFGEALLETVDRVRKPVFLMVDEGQLFSTSARRKDHLARASALINECLTRGRKRALDLFLSAHRFASSVDRAAFALTTLRFVGRQEDPATWSALAPQFKGSGITYADTAALAPGEFFCFSRQGVEKVQTPLAVALARVAPQATAVRSARPRTFVEWDRTLAEIPTPRLQALGGDVIALLGSLAGCSAQQLAAGSRALHDELGARA